MDVAYHPLVRTEVEEILAYYRRISPRLADEFRDELQATIDTAARSPLRFHPVGQGFRRANLARFPYHVLYEVHPDRLRVMLVRHNRRHPRYGLPRL
jgi:plasmid stabilization system protein ParE